MQNINYVGGAGSTTTAQFLQRFIQIKHRGSFNIAEWHFLNMEVH